MKRGRSFSLTRFKAIVFKEFVQMRRDRLTFGMMVGIPLLQLILFGFAINSDPRHLPTAVLSNDHSPFSRTLITAMENTTYFRMVRLLETQAQGDEMLRLGQVQFVLTIPPDFGSDLASGKRPILLLEADATDPAATSNAVNSLQYLVRTVFNRDLTGPLAGLQSNPAPVDLRIHAKYNPGAVTQNNIVPGLMGVILTMTLVVITSLAITRERERGTMENLLSTPVRPLEVLVGKIIPYIMVGYIQMTLIILAAKFVFHVPIQGNLPLLYLVSILFIASNLGMGITFSTIARNQLQAVQMSFFFFLPSLLLSGFMFPFRGMPVWAQYVGSTLPLTHYLRIVRGIVLKGNGLADIAPHLWPLALFLLVSMTVGVKRYRQTLD